MGRPVDGFAFPPAGAEVTIEEDGVDNKVETASWGELCELGVRGLRQWRATKAVEDSAQALLEAVQAAEAMGLAVYVDQKVSYGHSEGLDEDGLFSMRDTRRTRSFDVRVDARLSNKGQGSGNE